MASRVSGITVEIDGDVSGLNSALKDVNSEIKSTQSQLKDVEKLLKVDPSNIELLTQKQGYLNDAIAATKEKLNTLETAAEQANEQLQKGDITQEQYDALQREIIATKQQLNNLESEAAETSEQLGNVGNEADEAGDRLEETGDKAEKTGEQLDDTGDKAEDADSIFDSLQVTLGNLASQAITSVISKCKELASEIVSLGIDTETAFAKLETIAGSENIDDLTDSISDLAKETGVSSAELADVAYNAISAGASVETAMDMVESATKLAAGGFTDSASALSVLSTVMNSYGDTAGSVTDVSDSLVTTQNLGVTSVNELASSMGKAIATGSAYSVNLANLESAYVSLTKGGNSTAESTTYINSMLKELGDSGSDVSAILQEETGKSFTGLMEDGYSLADVLGVLYDSCDNDSTAMMNLWSSGEAGIASNAIINQGLTEFNENLETLTSSAGATEDAYATMADTTETKINIMKTNFEELGLEIYDSLEEPLNSAITFITETVIPGIENFIDDVKDLAAKFEENKPTIEAVTAAIAAFVVALNFSSIVSTVVGVLGGLKKAIMGVTAAMTANPIALIVALIAGLVAALVTLWNTNDEFREAVTEAWNKIKETISGAIDAVVQFLFDAWESIKTTVVDTWNSIVETLSGVWETIKTTVSDTFNSIVELISNAVNSIKTGVTNGFNSVKDAVVGAIQTVKEKITSIFSSIVETVGGFITKVKEKVTGITDAIKNGITDLVDKAKTWAKDMMDNFIQGIKDKISAVGDAITGVADKIKDFIGFSLPEKGPLSDADEYMPDFIELMTRGVKTSAGALLDELNSTAASMGDIFTGGLLGDYTPALADGYSAITGVVGGRAAASETNNTANYGGIYITVNGYNAQNDADLAERIADEIGDMVDVQNSVWK